MNPHRNHPKAHPIQAIEDLIDRYGLTATLSAISDICDKRAEYTALTIHDLALAKVWASVAHEVEIAATHNVGL